MELFGGAKKSTKSAKAKKTTKTTKSAKTTKTTKTSDAKKTKKSSTTRSKSKAKGGNFLGAVGDLVAPTGWGPFATAAGLLALDRADAALRRGTKEKKEKMKGGKKSEKKSEKKMKGGELTCIQNQPIYIPRNTNDNPRGYQYKVCCNYKNENICRHVTYDKRPQTSPGVYDTEKEKERFDQAKKLITSYIATRYPDNSNS